MTETAQLAQVVPQMLEWPARLDPQAAGAPKELPIVLAAAPIPLRARPTTRTSRFV